MKLLIIDDHPVLRDGLAAFLQQAGFDTVVMQASSVAEGLDIAGDHSEIDVVILDLMMPGVNGFDAISKLGMIRPDLPVMVLSSSENPSDVRRALALGALGYVPKSSSANVLFAAVRLVLEGGRYVPPLILDHPAQAVFREPMTLDAGRLTDRQVEVLRLVASGQPNKMIASSLELSEKTVKSHITAIFRALNVINRTQAAEAGRRAGLIA